MDITPNGNTAIVKLNKRHYDLCILDLRIPGIDGIELYEYINNKHSGLSQGVVFTAGDITNSHVSKILYKSEKVYLQKPVTPKDLITAVECALN